MVSTRNTKDKFSDGERVLCYEPDTSKAKVLYDSKVLEVKQGKDERGRKTVEYLIHFQGWNSSWDRVVSEDYVLKDTEENRQLQIDLAAKARLQLGAYLYRKEHSDKNNSTLSEKVFEASNSCSSQDIASASASAASEVEDQDQEQEHDDYLTATDVESVETDDSVEQVPLELSPALKSFLEAGYEAVNGQHKIVKLPASPNIIQILESYVRHVSARAFRRDAEESSRPRSSRQPAAPNCRTPAAPNSRAPATPNKPAAVDKTEELEWICAKVNLAKEMVDGLRICFDHYVGSQLLYAPEQAQYEEIKNGVKLYIKEEKLEVSSEDDASRSDDPFSGGKLGVNAASVADTGEGDRRRSLRSHKDPEPSSSTANGVNKLTAGNLGSLGGQGSVNVNNSAQSCSSASSYCGPLAGHAAHAHLTGAGGPLGAEMAKLMTLTSAWRLVPESYFYLHPQPPSTLYGAIHLARLFVKLPLIIYAANLPEKENQPRFLSEQKMKILLHNLQSFMKYLESKPEWFSDDNYLKTVVKYEY